MPVDYNDPKMEGYRSLEEFLYFDNDRSSRVRDYSERQPFIDYMAQALPFTPSGEGAVARTVEGKLREKGITPDDFGAVGDGVTDDTAAIAAVLGSALGASRVDGGGLTYKLTANVAVKDQIEVENCRFDFSAAPAGSTMFSAAGVQTTESLLSSSVLPEATSITVADGSLFSDGDYILLISDEIFETITNSKASEMNRVISVSGNTLNLQEPVLYSHSTTYAPKAIRLDFKENITLRRVSAVGGGPGLDHRAIGFTACRGVLVENCDFDLFDTRNVLFDRCAQFRVTGSRFSRSTRAGLAYGVTIANGSYWGFIDHNHFEEMRHGVTIGGVGGVNCQIVVDGNTCHGCTDGGIDAHPAANYVTFSNNVVMQGRGQDGIIYQGINGTIKGNTVRGATRHGILYQTACREGLSSLTIEGNTVHGSTGTGTAIYVIVQGDSPVHGVNISNNVVESGWALGIEVRAATASIYYVSISGNTLMLPTGAGILLNAKSTFTIWFGSIIGNVVRPGSEGIYLSAVSASGVQYIACIGNTMMGGTYGIRGVNTNRISAVGNIATAATTPFEIAGTVTAVADNIST